MSASKTAVRVERPESVVSQTGKKPPRFHLNKRLIPYLFIAPAVIFELFIHIIPMLVGIVVSLIGLTLFYIHYWTQAPFIGLQNYKVALNFRGAAGSALRYFLNSIIISGVATVISVALAILAGYALSRYRFPGRRVFSLDRWSISRWDACTHYHPDQPTGDHRLAIYSFMTAWNELLFASILTTDATRTLAVGLQGYATQSNVYWNQLMAASIVVSIPVVIGFLAVQKYMVQGLSAGAVK